MRFLHRLSSRRLALLAIACPALCWAANDTASAAPAAASGPFIALLLPLSSPEFAAPARAVRQGCETALAHSGYKVPLQVSPTDGSQEQIVAGYEAAVKRGARVVVGPMTRSGVAALAGTPAAVVPTLALNSPEGDVALPARIFVFGLLVEAEARLVARQAYANRLHRAVVVQAATPLARRIARAFAREWLALSGKILDLQDFGRESDLFRLKRRLSRSEADVIFLSANAEQARQVRPFLDNQLPTYSTSLVYDGRASPVGNTDLNGLHFVDMPWLIQPDHPAVMVYPRPENLTPEMQRFFALGIDACRIAAELAQDREHFALDGVTGWIKVGAGQVVEREPVAAIFRDGAAAAVDAKDEPR